MPGGPTVRRIAGGVLLVALGAFFLLAEASANTVPMRITDVLADPMTRGNIGMTARTTLPTVTRYTHANVPVTAGSLARMGKHAITGPWGLAITGAVVAYQLFWDEDAQEFMQEAPPPGEWNGTSYSFWTRGGSAPSECNYTRYPTAQQAAQACAQRFADNHIHCNGAYTCSVGTVTLTGSGPSGANIQINQTHNGNPTAGIAITMTLFNDTDNTGTEPPWWNDPQPPQQATPEAVAEAIEAGGLAPQVINNYFNSNQWHVDKDAPVQQQVWPELIAALNAINQAISQAEDDPTQLTPEQQRIVDRAAYDLPPEVVGGGASASAEVTVEIPTDCDFHPTLCAFLEWFQDDADAPESVEVPTVDLEDIAEDWDSGLGGGACPSNETLSLLGQSVTYTWAPLCEGAPLIRYLVIMVATVLGFTIVMGVRR